MNRKISSPPYQITYSKYKNNIADEINKRIAQYCANYNQSELWQVKVQYPFVSEKMFIDIKSLNDIYIKHDREIDISLNTLKTIFDEVLSIVEEYKEHEYKLAIAEFKKTNINAVKKILKNNSLYYIFVDSNDDEVQRVELYYQTNNTNASKTLFKLKFLSTNFFDNFS